MRVYYCQSNTIIYFLNENHEGKWVNELNIGTNQDSYAINNPESELMVIPLYKTDYLRWGEQEFYASDRGGIYVFRSFSKKQAEHNDFFGVYADNLVYSEDDSYYLS